MDSPKLIDGSVHTYAPLSEGGFIRLMHVEPALHVNAPICFSFKTAQLTKIVAQYEAISYTWGESKLINPLYLDDGTYVLVTKNLDKALRRLRHSTTTRVLWADAVCINQVDNDEKSTQIPLMARIFRGASKVLAWLDDGAEEERGMLLLEQLSRYQEHAKNEFEGHSRSESQHSWKEEENYMIIHKFLGLAWFARLWIIQEIVMNADVILFCGTSSMTWVRFTAALSNHRHLQPRGTLSINQHRLDAIQAITNLWRQHSSISVLPTQERSSFAPGGILEIVNKFWGYGCTDPRDRIFALYSMTMDIQPSTYQGNIPCVRMDVDYSSSVAQVYQDFASACIARSRPILDAVLARQYTPGSNKSWPSWIPDWREPPSLPYHWRSTEKLACHTASPSILGIWPAPADRSDPENFPVIDHIFVFPDTIEESMKFLLMLCRDWPHLTLDGILRALLPDRSRDERKAFAYHIARTYEARPAYTTSTMDAQLNLSLRYGMRLHLLSKESIFEHTVYPSEDLNSRGWEGPPSYITSAMIAQLNLDLQAAMKYHRFFSTTKPRRIIGYGNAAMAKGDKIFVFDQDLTLSVRNYQSILLLRPSATRTIGHMNIATHRLIGSGWFFTHTTTPIPLPENSSLLNLMVYIE
jgi:hypothetical protein